MSCEQSAYCEENCAIPCQLDNCSNDHLTTFCPPVCKKCCPKPSFCIDPCSSGGCCVSSCGDPCSDPCSVACCSSSCQKQDPCSRRYEIIKHIVKCSKPQCCQITRKNFKPVEKCALPPPCDPCCTLRYETIYMKSFNTPRNCCLPTCW